MGGEGAHGADAPPHFDKEPFDPVGRAQLLPVRLGAIQEGQQLLQVAFQTRHSLGGHALPAAFPFPKSPDRFGAMLGLVDEFGLVQAALLGSF